MKLLLDEMYPGSLVEVLSAVGIDARTVASLGLRGSSDADVFVAAIERDETLLTENVADFARISADHLTSGLHHPGILIALSTRFSRRPAGMTRIADAIQAVADRRPQDRVIYLEDGPARR